MVLHQTPANPYEPPTSDQVIVSSKREIVRLLFSLVNFATSVLFFISCVIAIATMESPGSFFGGILGFAPLLIYSLCEWLVLYRRRVTIERKLGFANLACAAFVVFGIVTNIGEALMDESPLDFTFLFWFAIIGGSIFAYLIACGWCRLRWTRVANSAL